MAQTTPINTGYTIINGTTSGSNGSKVNTWIEYKVTAQSTVNNTSTLDVYLYSQATTSLSTIWERSGNYGYVQVDSGTKQYTTLSNGYNFQNKHLNTFAHHTFTINHNSDGTKTITLKGAWDKGSSTSSYITGGTVSGSVTLPQIARASTIPNFTCNLGSQGTISITRQSSSFTHTITYSIGGSTGTIATKTENASVTWTPPVSLITEITNATSKTGTLTCTTYSGNTAIGTSTSTLTLKVPNSTISDITAELGVSKTITVTNPCSTQLTYVVTYKFPSTATAVQIWSSTSKTYSYSFPTSLAAQISNAVSGTGTITVQTKNGTASVGTASATLTLSIPKASIGNISATMGTAKTITINNYGMSSLEYKITYSFGTSSGTVTNRTSSTSISYTFPTTLVTQIPNAASGTGTLTITTYNGTTTIGSRTSTLTLTAQASAVPTGSLTLTINNSNPTISGWGIAVQGYSTITASLTGTGNNGSTISQMSISGIGIAASGNYSTSPATLSATSPVLTTTGSQTYSAAVVDSRGRSASVSSQSVTVWQYSLPTLSDVSLARCLSDGTLDTSGTYLKTVYTAGYSSLDGNNTATVKVQYKLVGANSWTTYSGAISSGGAYNIPLDVSKNYVARLQIQDALNTVYSTETSIPSGSRILNVNPTGDSLAVGGFADVNASDEFKVYWNTKMTNGLTVNGYNMLNSLVYKGVLDSTVDIDDMHGAEYTGYYAIRSSIPTNYPNSGWTWCYFIVLSNGEVSQQYIFRPSTGFIARHWAGNPAHWYVWHYITTTHYVAGDTLSITSYTDLNGFITSSATSVSFSLYTPKNLANITSITVTSFTGTLRGISGYLNNQTTAKNWLSDSNYTITATKMSDNMIRIVCDKSSAFTNVTNNTPVSYYGTVGLSFS